MIKYISLVFLFAGCHSVEYYDPEPECWHDSDTYTTYGTGTGLYHTDDDTGLDTDGPFDTDCIGNRACTLLLDPRCLKLDGAEEKYFLRNYDGCACVDGIEYHFYRDKMCLEGCTKNPFGVDYCSEDAQYFEDH